jgi:hypothetical protein
MLGPRERLAEGVDRGGLGVEARGPPDLERRPRCELDVLADPRGERGAQGFTRMRVAARNPASTVASSARKAS